MFPCSRTLLVFHSKCTVCIHQPQTPSLSLSLPPSLSTPAFDVAVNWKYWKCLVVSTQYWDPHAKDGNAEC